MSKASTFCPFHIPPRWQVCVCDQNNKQHLKQWPNIAHKPCPRAKLRDPERMSRKRNKTSKESAPERHSAFTTPHSSHAGHSSLTRRRATHRITTQNNSPLSFPHPHFFFFCSSLTNTRARKITRVCKLGIIFTCFFFILLFC